MDRAKKMDSRANGEVTFTGATTEFQLKKGLTHFTKTHLLLNWILADFQMKFCFIE
jgi:hypothetical protein